MAYDYAQFVRKVFKHTSRNNPLRELSDVDKQLVVSLVHVYLMDHLLAGNADRPTKALDQIGVIAAEASDLANRMRALVFGGQLAAHLSPFVGKFKILPPLLEAFASQTSQLLNQFGKPGHKRKLLRNANLIIGSEFIHAVAGSYFDEHLAEVIQAVAFKCNPSSEAEDLSGDAIHKTRERIRKAYPAMYALYCNRAQEMALKSRPASPAPSESGV